MEEEHKDEEKSVDGDNLEKKESLCLSDSTRFSVDDHNPKYVFVEANRDILMEIGYAEDKARLTEINRLVEWDPTFWSLNDEIVSWFNDDDAVIRQKIDELKLSISQKEAKLINTRKKMRIKNRERGIFHPSLDVFPGLVEPPNTEEPFGEFSELGTSISKVIRELEMAKIKNLENEFKLASMEEKLNRLRKDAKGFEERNKNFDINANLMAVETQNSMLNELLKVIVQKIQQTTQGMENLKSSDPTVLVGIIKDASDLNFKIINECYPNMESKPGVSQWLWLPHDVKHMSFDDYIKTIEPKDPDLDINIDWKQLKKNVQEVEETRNQLMKLKRKVRLTNQRKSSGQYGTIQYMTEAEILTNAYGSIREIQF